MVRDSRGGHNRKRVNEDFFKTWSPKMAYVLGLLFADGALINANKSSRTQYVALSSIDYDLINDVRKALHSSHVIYVLPSKPITIFGKTYIRSVGYKLRIGNKVICHDLLLLGLQPKKSLVMNFPNVPPDYLSFFIRGYFDGDGCVHLTRISNKADKLKLIYISGSKLFIDKLRTLLVTHTGCGFGCLYKEDGAFRLQYNIRDGLRIMDFMYRHLNDSPFLKRKYEIYEKCLEPDVLKHLCRRGVAQ
jgi:hypothetical protein